MSIELGVATPTEELRDLATYLFGEEWAGSLSRFTDVNLRTCQRIKVAAETEADDPKAAGVLRELLNRTVPVLARARPRLAAIAAEAPPTFICTLLPAHAGVCMYADKATMQTLRGIVLMAAQHREERGAGDTLLLALSYDLRKAINERHEADFLLVGNEPEPLDAESETPKVGVKMWWPVVLVQLRLLRATAAYITLLPDEQAVLSAFEETVLDALFSAYDAEEDAEDVIEAWHEMGLNPFSSVVDQLGENRAAWFAVVDEARRRRALHRLLDSMSGYYDPDAFMLQEGAPSLDELDEWRGLPAPAAPGLLA